jgi:uncharacterized membrane protein (DUF373 family)
MAPEPRGPANAPPEPAPPRALRWVGLVEQAVVVAALFLMVVLVIESTVELGWLVVDRLVRRPLDLIESGRLLDVFGAILLVLIGLELLVTLRAYLRDHVLHLHVVLEVALVALARKVIVLDLERYDGLTLLGLGALVAALSLAIHLQRREARASR